VARAAGIPVIAVSFGYTDVPAAKLGADRVIDGYARLAAAVSELAAPW
jgi:phosphoglycolate phosphatase